MKVDLGDLDAFVAVARAKGFREGARLNGSSASGLSEAVRRLEAQLGVRLLHRTTRSLALNFITNTADGTATSEHPVARVVVLGTCSTFWFVDSSQKQMQGQPTRNLNLTGTTRRRPVLVLHTTPANQ